jgi:NAD+ kinase
MIQVWPYFAEDNRGDDVRQWLDELDQFDMSNIERYQAALSIGGDGTLLSLIHEHSHCLHLPIFGINRGTCGFLLNSINSKEELAVALESFEQWQIVELQMLRVQMHLRDGSTKEEFAFNDAFFKAKRGEIAGIVRGESLPDLEFCGDGIIVSTPQGSTAYNKSAGGSIISLERGMIGIASICSALEPIRLSIKDRAIEIEITRNINQTVFRADRFDTDNCIGATITHDGPIVSLAFLPGYNFEKRRYQPRFK